jgi:stress response protein SCP2
VKILQRGNKSKLSEALNPAELFTVELTVDGKAAYDFSCFSLGSGGKNQDDGYYIFYNQLSSPQKEITLDGAGNPARFTVNLAALPPWITELHFTVSIEGPGTMGEIKSCKAVLQQNGAEAFQMSMSGGDFKSQKALIVLEIYTKSGEWRISAVASGFDGGLPVLLTHYGIDMAEEGGGPRPPQSPRLPHHWLRRKAGLLPRRSKRLCMNQISMMMMNLNAVNRIGYKELKGVNMHKTSKIGGAAAVLIFSALLTSIFPACGKRGGVTIAKPYPVPPGVSEQDAPWETQGVYPVLVYWSNSTSERGYKGLKYKNFCDAVDLTIQHFVPSYYKLEFNRDSGKIEWRPTKDAPPYTNAIGGDFTRQNGPLKMLYEEGLVRADDLSVVITDLEEQGVNSAQLAKNIVKIILDGAKNTQNAQNAAAIIALKIDFDGINTKPNLDDPRIPEGPSKHGEISGKPLYLVATGKRGAVAKFVSQFMRRAGNIEYWTAATSNLARLGFEDIEISESAANKDIAALNKANKRIRLEDLGEIRNAADSGAPNRIWNLQRAEQADFFDSKGDILPLTLLNYQIIKGSKAKNGERVWQFNINVNLNDGLDAKALSVRLDNYRYLEPTDERNKNGAYLGEWKNASAAELERDFRVSPAAALSVPGIASLYVMPKAAAKNKEGTVLSPVICFDMVVSLSQNTTPAWVDDFDDTATSNKTVDHTKTYGLKTIVETIMDLDTTGKSKGVEAELIRFPVVIANAPSDMKAPGKKKKE